MHPGRSHDRCRVQFVTHDPGKEKEANWLPAPDGEVYLAMRLYWPKDTPPSILPAGEGTWQPPAIVQVP